QGGLRDAEASALQRHPCRHADVAAEEVTGGARDPCLVLVGDGIDLDVRDAARQAFEGELAAADLELSVELRLRRLSSQLDRAAERADRARHAWDDADEDPEIDRRQLRIEGELRAARDLVHRALHGERSLEAVRRREV